MALAWESVVPSSYRSAFVAKVTTICSRLGIDPNWLMIVMYFESGGTFDPAKRNANSSAVGLIQFTSVTWPALHTTGAQLAAMSAVDQLDKVEEYLSPYKGRMTDLYNTYLAVFAPAYIGRPDAQKVYASPSDSYTKNKVLDTNKDGIITVGEIKSVISRYVPNGYSSGTTIVTTVVDNAEPIGVLLAGGFLLFLLFRRA